LDRRAFGRGVPQLLLLLLGAMNLDGSRGLVTYTFFSNLHVAHEFGSWREKVMMEFVRRIEEKQT
jgi:hypothetical protein